MQNISTLKSLTQATFDSVEGYRNAIGRVDNPALKTALERRKNSREETLSKLNSLLEENGEDRITSASMKGSTHHMFTAMADMFSDDNEAAAKRVEEGEDYIASQFRDALKNNDWDPQSRMVIEQAANDVFEGERFSDKVEKQYA